MVKTSNKYLVVLIGLLAVLYAMNVQAISLSGLFAVISGPAISSSATSAQGTLSDTYETYVSGWNADGKQVRMAKVNGVQTLMVPWFSLQTSDLSTEANLHKNECGATGTFNDFCIVTDEASQYYLGLSMSRNSALLSQQAGPAFNMVKEMAKTANDANGNQPYGVTQSWLCRGIINADGTGSISNCKKDFASDADARLIIGTWNFINNPNVVDNNLKNEMRTRVSAWCGDFKRYSYTTYAMKSPIDGRTINHWYGGGGNVARTITSGQFAYPGYHGDAALAMMACGMGLNDASYFTYADETLEQWLIAAKWNPTSGLKIPHCRSGNWAKDANGYAVYTGVNGCPSPQGTDDADAVRFTSMCTADYFAEKNGIAINNHIGQFCDELKASSGYSPTAWSVQWYSTGQPKSGKDGGPHGTGLGGYVDLGTVPANLAVRHQALSQQWNSNNKAFNGQSSFGIYWGGFDVIPLGYGLGRADDTFRTGLSYTPMTSTTGGSLETPVCPSGASGTYPGCTCTGGKTYQQSTNSCITQTTAPVCPSDSSGTYPGCTCQAGKNYNSQTNTCVTVQQTTYCPTGSTGTYPSCACPVGQNYVTSSNSCVIQQTTAVTTTQTTTTSIPAQQTSGGGGAVVGASTTTTVTAPVSEPASDNNTYFYIAVILFIMFINKRGRR